MAKKQLKKKIQHHSDTFYITRQNPGIVQSWNDSRTQVNRNRRETREAISRASIMVPSSAPEIAIPYNGTPVKDKTTHVSYIGGDRDAARKSYWEEAPIIKAATDSIAGRYGINPELLRSRLNKEGFTDSAINLYNGINTNVDADNRNNIRAKVLGYPYLHSEGEHNIGIQRFGLDDGATYINSGLAHLINESWNNGEFTNEKGRVTNAANGASILDNMGIMASLIKGFRDQAAKDYPNATPEELDNYANIYYNRGITGGRNYINNGNGSTPYTMAEGGSLQTHKPWNNLSMAEKAEMIGVAVRNGITSLPEIRAKYNEFAEGGDTVGEWIDAIYQNNPKEEFLGEPEHHYDFTQSEEWANAHGYYPDARGHRDDRVKKPAHPSHPSRGTWNGDKFILTDTGMENPNYTLFGLNDGGQDPQAILTYQGGSVIPEVTVTPNGNYIYNPYDNIKLHYSEGGNLYGGGSYLDKAKAMIRANEGWRSKPYKDAPKGKNWRSVGYGFNDSGFWERYPEGISKHYENGITKAQAEKELDYFLGKAERQLKGIYGKRWNSFNDDQKAAILDTYYQRPASVGSKSGFYGAVMSGKDGAPYLGVQGFGDRNQSRRDLYRGRGVTAPVSFESMAEPVVSGTDEVLHFEPLNPQVFGMQLPTYQAPVIDTIDTIDRIDTIDKTYDPAAIEKQERQDNLRRFGMFMSMLDGASGQDSGMPDFIDMLAGKPMTYGKGGHLYDGGGYVREVNNHPVAFDAEGNLVDQVTGGKGHMLLPEVSVTANSDDVARGRAQRWYRDFDIESNDATSVADGRRQNSHLDEWGIEGAAKAAAWAKDHPVLNNVGLGLSTIPLAVAATPAVVGGGELAATALANPYVDAALTSMGGAHAAQSLANGEANWMTALELAPLGRLAKPVYEGVVQPGMRLFNSPLTGNWTKIGNREYRLSPNSLGANGSLIESRKIGDYSMGIDLNKMRGVFEDYEKGLTQYKGSKLPNSLEFNYEMPKIDFDNLVKDDFVDYLNQQTGRAVKRVPIKDTKHGDIYNEGFAFVDDEGKEIAYIAGDRKAGKNVWIGSSFVAPEFRHQGLGKQMYFDFNDHVFNTYGTTLHSSPYQRVGFTGAGESPSNRLWKSLREKGMSSLEGEGLNRYDVMAEPSKITTAYRTPRTPQITAENAASMIPEQWTAAQDAAIARGDMTEAQRLRDLHQSLTPTATSGKYYRGTKIKRNSYPDRHIDEEVGEMNGIYLTKKPKYAKTYGDVEGFYLRSNNPLETEGSWTGIIDDATRAEIENAGYDAVVNNRFDTGFLNKLLRNSRDETITFNGKNLKSADAITYDNNGVRIPLGERDNFNLNDIRYGLLPLGIGLTGYGLNQKRLGGRVKLGDGGYVRERNNNPIAFDADGNLVDQITGEKGYILLPEVKVTAMNPRKPITTGIPREIINVKSRLYENLSPIDYSDLTRVPNAILLNKPDMYHDKMKNMPVLDEIYAQYLGIPEKDRHFNTRLEKSEYRPTQGGENVTYYKLPQKRTYNGRTVIGDYHWYDGSSNTYLDDLVYDATYMNPGTNKQQVNTELGYYTVGRGRDNNGDYVSYYDKWDINPFSGRLQNNPLPKSVKKALSNVNMDFGTPVHIYDRIHFDDYYDVPEEYRGGYYLPEVIVK